MKISLSEIACAQELPGLHAQSAPVSTEEMNDSATDFHVSHAASSYVYTAFRDHSISKFREIRFAE